MKNEITKICVYGTGGVGGYFGALLACGSQRPETKREIYFIARGAHLEAIQKNGLVLHTGKDSELVCKPTIATDSFDELPAPDLILLTVKGYDLEETIKKISGRVKENTIILPLLNGVDIYQRITGLLSRGVVLPACVYVVSTIEKPGFVTQKGAPGKIIFGKDPRLEDKVSHAVQDVFRQSGIEAVRMDNAFPAIWEKYLFIAPFALVTGRYGATFGSLMASPDLQEKTRQVMREVIAIARHEGIEFRDAVIEETLRKANNFPFESTTSFQRDLKKGGKNEGDLLGGTIIRLGKKYGVPVPVTTELYTAIQRNA